MTDRLSATADGIERAAALLRAGHLVAFPTDTVYGVGVAAKRPDRVEALFALKHRPIDRRIPMLIADLSGALAEGGQADERAKRLAAALWPGALTLVMPAGAGTQAYRAPDHPVALELIRRAGAIFATSANRSDEPDTLGADDVLIAFATQQDELAAVVDGGVVPGGAASTVLDLSVTPARVLRDGPIGIDELAALVDVES